MASFLNLDVGGFRYTLDANDVLKFPTSRLATVLANCAREEIIKIERDGRVFQYVASYLVCGHIPRNNDGTFRLDATTLASFNEEAVYYGLDQLSADCKQSCRTSNNGDLSTYLCVHKHIQEVKDHYGQGENSFQVDFISARSTVHDLKINVLLAGAEPDSETLYSYSIPAKELSYTVLEIANALAKDDLEAFAPQQELIIMCD
eukprot:gene10332-12084_t